MKDGETDTIPAPFVGPLPEGEGRCEGCGRRVLLEEPAAEEADDMTVCEDCYQICIAGSAALPAVGDA